jgi:hypothetical protein
MCALSLTDFASFVFRNYNQMVGVVPGLENIEERSGEVKKTVFEAMTLSRSL